MLKHVPLLTANTAVETSKHRFGFCVTGARPLVESTLFVGMCL